MPEVPKTAVSGLKCAEPGCNGTLRIRWTVKLQRWFYGCDQWPQCIGILPAKNDGSPNGEPRTRELQGWRTKAHSAFDPIWKNGYMSRGKAYKWLQGKLGWDHTVHMGSMTIEQCQRVIEIMARHYPDESKW